MEPQEISRVYRSKKAAGRFYSKVSGAYDALFGRFERKYKDRVLEHLNIQEGETALEIGFGTGYCLEQMAQSVREQGQIYGIDISEGMINIAQKRIKRRELADRVNIFEGDAAKSLPFEDDLFDVALMSFVLELFDTAEIPEVLEHTKRVLKPGGRLGVVSISKRRPDSLMTQIYELGHEFFPRLLDCRPIYVERALNEAGYKTIAKQEISIFGLPGEIVVATPRYEQ